MGDNLGPNDRTTYDGSLRELCINKKLGVVTYYSLASGFLSGKYRSTADLGKASVVRVWPNISTNAV
jgi:aryl-alcohol dehydrogenase-like predicted oxidoreductase